MIPPRIRKTLLRAQCCLVAISLLWLAGCASRVSTDAVRADVSSGNIGQLREKMQKSHESNIGDFVAALNLARAWQLEGEWEKSIAAYGRALVILEEYEARAVVSVRNVAGDTGSFLLSRGASGYFGTGYERSLLHTFNALNYAMLGDFNGAAVEMRKMEQRQEAWLQESSKHIEKSLEGNERILASYSLRDALELPEVRNMANSYQDPFSYALSGFFNRLTDNREFAEVSVQRATALSPENASLFEAALRGKKKGKANKGNAEQEVIVVAVSGLAPALRVEQKRVAFPQVGYIMFDLPSYAPPLRDDPRYAVKAGDAPLSLTALLNVERLAYRLLRDELGREIAFSITRALARTGAAMGVRAALASNKDTSSYADAGGLVANLLLDAMSTALAASTRNWEMLPHSGALGIAGVPAGSTVRVAMDGMSREISLPENAQGALIFISQLPRGKGRIDYSIF
jgi:hypothetical protein